MGGLVSVLNGLPFWAGNIPVWTLLIIVSGYILHQMVKNQPVLNEQKINERLNIKSGYIDRITQLEAAVAECERKCDEREELFKAQIAALQEKVNNDALQRVQSEISLVSILLDVVDAPQLKKILVGLQSRQITLESIRLLEQKEQQSGTEDMEPGDERT